jgi:hypothetical protein
VTGLSRRALCLAGVALPWAGAVLAQPAPPAPTWLAAIARALFPHSWISDAHYARLAGGWWDALPAVDRAGAAAALAGVDPAQPATLGAFLATPAGQGLRFALVTGLYADPAIYRRLGFEGPSADQGGYLERGFDDMRWLPRAQVTEDQSWLG